MSAWLIAFTGCVYFYVALEQYIVHKNTIPKDSILLNIEEL